MGVVLKDNKDGTTWEIGAANERPRPCLNSGLRPMLPTDAPFLAEIFRAAIEELAAEDYSETQREAWASTADDEEEFGKRLAGKK